MARNGRMRTMSDQSRAVLRGHLSLTSRHAEKQAQGLPGTRSTGKIHSIATFDKYARALQQAGEWARQAYGIQRLKDITPERAQAYLEYRAAQGIGQKQLNADRTALEFVTGHDTLEHITSLQDKTLQGRAYTREQVEIIVRHQDPANALASRIAFEAGLRGHELLTLRRRDEQPPSAHRQWSPQRFTGREGERYTVTGKGGLKREVLLSHATARELETRRLAAPRPVTDRGIHYPQHYEINGGLRWARSFSAASQRALGWSTGAHGVRHAYAQTRMEELARQGLKYVDAREVLSQELGHFRGDIVETYLR